MPTKEKFGSQFIDQIVQITLERVSDHDIFDEKTLKRLQELAASSVLTDSKKVVEALSIEQGN